MYHSTLLDFEELVFTSVPDAHKQLVLRTAVALFDKLRATDPSPAAQYVTPSIFYACICVFASKEDRIQRMLLWGQDPRFTEEDATEALAHLVRCGKQLALLPTIPKPG